MTLSQLLSPSGNWAVIAAVPQSLPIVSLTVTGFTVPVRFAPRPSTSNAKLLAANDLISASRAMRLYSASQISGVSGSRRSAARSVAIAARWSSAVAGCAPPKARAASISAWSSGRRSKRITRPPPIRTHADRLRALPHADDVVGRLHPKERVHPDAKRLLEPQGHLPGQISLAIEEARERWSRTPEHPA